MKCIVMSTVSSLLPRAVPVHSTVMQKSIWLLAFLACLPWLRSFVHGAVVLTLPSNTTRLDHPLRLNDTNGIVGGISVIDKERGTELPAAQLFEAGIWLMATWLAPEDFEGFIPSQAWSTGDIILGVSVDEQERGVVQRPFIIYGFYFIFLLMKQEKDFRSGVFQIQYLGTPVCDLVILPTGSSRLKLAPSFTHVTQLHPPPSPTASNTIGSPQGVVLLNTTSILPLLIQPMDELGQLISIVDMLVTAAWPPETERIRKNIESIVPFSGVNISLSLAPNDTPDVLRYGGLIWSLSSMADTVQRSEGQGLRGQMYSMDGYLGEITMLPSNSAASTNPLIQSFVTTSTDRATSR